jgi:hypothetical protein
MRIGAGVARAAVVLVMAGALGAVAVPAQAAGGLSCRYVLSQWPGGFSADLTIANHTTSTINGWTAYWTFTTATRVTNTWMGSIAQSTPYDATGRNAPYNGVIRPGGSTSLGWTATAVSTEVPAEILVNGVRCPVG